MNNKNYTSSVEASRSMAKIEELLVEIEASNITKQYADKICTGITLLFVRCSPAANLAISFKGTGRRMFYHSLARCKTATARYQSCYPEAGQPYLVENPFRLDKSAMQRDTCWAGKAAANVPAVYVRYENERGFV
jgi:hypothetical protein